MDSISPNLPCLMLRGRDTRAWDLRSMNSRVHAFIIWAKANHYGRDRKRYSCCWLMRRRMSSDSLFDQFTTRCGQPLRVLLIFFFFFSQPIFEAPGSSSPLCWINANERKTSSRYLSVQHRRKTTAIAQKQKKTSIIVSLENQCDCPVQPEKEKPESEGGMKKN